ncbi:glycerol-3-phosphate dehydrogenase/oxidase [Thiorhodovibrio frisius]|uniref:Glycerol-3-phosphate dehydrogenase n=1 Tax=Thiorhodovibrio frisius TaxID=631362 RepID=H8Z2J1_9GAMM|nr:glycerol-3-phosphate dehydrogenase/oxidase [Thiorhodovibrio frisius]EIC22684.1 glycerol-3-phosphate dehydrogenase [Thiorhodovibrio frisius]WPL22440.1 Aerobic glycerol-3-phosphate dehydrogenase [Thiorhodovibrio frisius]
MHLRDSNIAKLPNRVFDALIIGGGINGAVAAAALSGKDASVALIDQRDFAGFTSQQSSNLAWGGIKYLESGDYGLVRKLCLSRNHLIDSYPSRVQEIRFFTTIDKGFRFSPWFLWVGTWVYWLFGNGYTRIPRLLSKAGIKREESVVNTSKAVGGFEYSDAYLHDNDSRFVFQFVRAAMDRGAIAANYVESLGSRRESQGKDAVWITEARDTQTGQTFQIRSKILVNAAGPFVDELNQRSGEQTEHQHLFSKGIHLIVPQVTPQPHILTFFADDGRLFFVIPMGVRTCIGTTDTRVDSPFTEVTDEDRDFVLENINKRLELERPLTRADIIAERCGVRPLVVKRKSDDEGDGVRDWMQLSRKHEIDVDQAHAHVSIYGGKLTDCVNVGNEVSEIAVKLGIELPHADYRWYGEPHRSVYEEYMHQARLMDLDSYTSSDSIEQLSSRLWRRYDQQAFELLAQIREDPRQAEVLIKGTDYLRCEIQLAKRQEMIVKLEDFLRRRSKIALVVSRQTIQQAEGLMEACKILFGDQAQARYDEYFCDSCRVTPAQSQQSPPQDSPID